MDAMYHASGVLAANIGSINKTTFPHNDMNALEDLLRRHQDKKRRIVAVEGIYSMDGDMVPREVFGLCERYNAILIVDEAHSSGVVGEKLMGVYDHYGIKIAPNHIKMGTLGKAYGSFGAYILASNHIVTYLLNRAKPLIYATSLSLYDTLRAHYALEYIVRNKETLKKEIALRQELVCKMLSTKMQGLILPLVIGENKKVLQIQSALEKRGFFIGAIREPTVSKAILRIIARIEEPPKRFEELLELLKRYL
jgi:8-amino-7-oxononanoate synthase